MSNTNQKRILQSQSMLAKEYGKHLMKEIKRKRRRSAMDIAAEECGLIKVRGSVSGKVYYE